MLYVALYHAKPTATTQEIMARRLAHEFPPHLHVLGEYWLPNSKLAVVAIYEAESPAPIFAKLAQWDDLFECDFFPAVAAEQGLALAREMLAKVAVPA